MNLLYGKVAIIWCLYVVAIEVEIEIFQDVCLLGGRMNMRRRSWSCKGSYSTSPSSPPLA